MKRDKTGGVRMEQMLRGGVISKPFLFIDTYHQSVSDVPCTILTRVDSSSLYFVSVYEER